MLIGDKREHRYRNPVCSSKDLSLLFILPNEGSPVYLTVILILRHFASSLVQTSTCLVIHFNNIYLRHGYTPMSTSSWQEVAKRIWLLPQLAVSCNKETTALAGHFMLHILKSDVIRQKRRIFNCVRSWRKLENASSIRQCCYQRPWVVWDVSCVLWSDPNRLQPPQSCYFIFLRQEMHSSNLISLRSPIHTTVANLYRLTWHMPHLWVNMQTPPHHPHPLLDHTRIPEAGRSFMSMTHIPSLLPLFQARRRPSSRTLRWTVINAVVA